MPQARRKKPVTLYIFAAALFICGMGYLVWQGISANSVYFLNVSEALAMPSEELGAARLFGTVAEGETRMDNGLGVRFFLEDAAAPGQKLLVEYRGVVPDTFKPGAEVIVEGNMQSAAFNAKTLMTKCPSKYEKENRPGREG